MEILDIHTHHLPAVPGQAIVNVAPDSFEPQSRQWYSVGFHPWYLSEDGSEDWSAFSELVSHPQVLAIGEAGLDKVTEVSYSLQEGAFKRQITIAMEIGKPLIIHCVRSYNEVMEFKKSLKPDTPWVIHGFRGKKELARQLTDHGIYLSYGFHYHEDALQSTPPEMFFLETDENTGGIHNLYKQAAGHLSLSVSDLTRQIQQNISHVFNLD